MDTKKSKKIVVIGASPKPERYAYKAVLRLKENGYEPVPLGIRKGAIGEEEIITGFPPVDDVDTVTLYINPQIQNDMKDYIFSLSPRRIIFNPGTENEAFKKEAEQSGIQTVEACTLVMLSVGNF